MRPSFKSMFKRATERTGATARELAGGSAVPAGQETVAQPRPGGRQRAAARRRIRRLRRLREARLRDLGLLIVELERRGRQNPELVGRKTAQLRAIDDGLTELATALGGPGELDQVVLAGIAGNCSRCGSLIAVDDNYCPNCGLAMASIPPPPPPPAAAVETATPPAVTAPSQTK